MVFTAAQVTAFFEDGNQMGLSNRTRVYLGTEGIAHPSDLVDFVESEAWDQLIENCKRPPQVPDPANAGQLINQAPFRLPAKSLTRLRIAAKVVEYYVMTSRPLSATNMMWVRLSNFQVEHKTLLSKKKANDELTLPVISQKLSIANWFEAYETYAGEFIGQANCPLTWIFRESVNVAVAAPALMADQPYSEEHGSVAEELVHRLPHTHPLYRIDNATCFSQIVTATLGTSYASTITPFKRTKNGRSALLALKAQFAGPAHWDKEVRVMNDFLMNSRWTGTTPFTLSAFLAKHRASFNTLQRCADHVSVELPNERTRVGYLIDNIDCQDKDVTTALSHIRLDDNVNGMRGDFEKAVAFLLPTDPVKKKKRGRRNEAQVSAAVGGEANNSMKDKNNKKKKKVSFKPNCGKNGVQFCYYKSKEFNKLTKEQRDELREYRKANGNQYQGAWSGKEAKATIAAAIKEHEESKTKEAEERNAMKAALVDELRGVITAKLASLNMGGNSGTGAKRTLQRVGSNANISSTDASESHESAAEHCATNLMAKFCTMGSKTVDKFV